MTRASVLAGLFALAVAFFPAFGQAAPASCSPLTKVYFGNGVANTRLDAQESMWSLVPLAEEAGLEDFEVALAYNPTEGLLLDVVETIEQKIAEDDRFSWYLANNILGYTLRGLTIPRVIARKHAPLIKAIQGYVNDAIANVSGQSTPYYDATIGEHVQQYLGDLSQGRRVLAVAHSQGNLYANSAYGLLRASAPALAESFGIVSVATPAETSLNGYVTSENDLVVGLLRKLGQTVLKPNVNVPIALDDLSGHTFLNTYLHTGKPARAKVRSLLTKVSASVPIRSAICDYEDGKLTAVVGQSQKQVYTFDLDAGQHAYFRASEIGATPFWPDITINEPSGARLANTHGLDVAGLHFEAPVSGKYTIIVADGSSSGAYPGKYDLYWAFIPGANEGGLLTSGSTIQGTIDQGDLDSYTFTAVAGEGIVASFADVGATGLWPGIAVYDPFGDLATPMTHGTDTALVRFTAESSGTYTLMLFDDATGLSATGDYDLHFVQALGPSEGGTLLNDGVVSGSFTHGDLDSYSFSANAGDLVMLRVADVDDTALWPGIIVFDPTGAHPEPPTHGTDTAVSQFTATKSGVYTVVVFDNSTAHAAVADYDLYFARAPGANEGGALSAGQPVEGSIDHGDLDSYTFTTVAGMEVVVTATELGDTTFWPGLTVQYPNGQTTSTQGTSQATKTFLAPVSGTYTVIVYDASTSHDGTSSYSLGFTAAPKAP